MSAENLTQNDVELYEDIQGLINEIFKNMGIFVEEQTKSMIKVVEYELGNPSAKSIEKVTNQAEETKTKFSNRMIEFEKKLNDALYVLPKEEKEAFKIMNDAFKKTVRERIEWGCETTQNMINQTDILAQNTIEKLKKVVHKKRDIQLLNPDDYADLIKTCKSCGGKLSFFKKICKSCGKSN